MILSFEENEVEIVWNMGKLNAKLWFSVSLRLLVLFEFEFVHVGEWEIVVRVKRVKLKWFTSSCKGYNEKQKALWNESLWNIVNNIWVHLIKYNEKNKVFFF